MAERIIKIMREEEKNEIEEEADQKLSEPMEQLALALEKKLPALQIQVRRAEGNEDLDAKYLKEFDQFEERSECTLPNANIPEKIIIVIDRAQDEKCTPFLGEKSKFSPLSMLRRVVRLFLKLKHMINERHQFALVVLNENNASWLCDFTNDPKKLNFSIERITQCDVEDSFNLNTLFSEIMLHVELPEVSSPEVAPGYIIRPVILYGRSYTIPTLELDPEINKFLNHPYFVVDALMTHEPVDRSNNCNKIFEALQNIDKKGLSYFFPVGRDTRRLHRCMAKLLAHPLQRPIQKLHKI